MRMVVEEKKRFQTCEITAFLYSAEASLTMAGQLNGLSSEFLPPSGSLFLAERIVFSSVLRFDL